MRNIILCSTCWTVIESIHVHQLVKCECGIVGVDGGHEYLRRIGSIEDYEELSEWVCSQT